MTYNRLSEIACHLELPKPLKMGGWFCKPHPTRQHGSKERTKGLRRQFMPESTAPSHYHRTWHHDLAALVNKSPGLIRPGEHRPRLWPTKSRLSDQPLHLKLESKELPEHA